MHSFAQLQPGSTVSEELLRKTLPKVNCLEVLRIMEPMKNYAPCLWHKWDAHEHSNQVFLAVGKFMSHKTPDFPMADIAYHVLNQEIEGMQKWRLLSLVGLLHDVGKGYLGNSRPATGHTMLSLEVIDRNKVNLGLSDRQFEFLRCLIENHHKFDKIEVSDEYEFSRSLLPKSEYLCESAIFTLFDMSSCQGLAYTDRSSPLYDQTRENIENRKRLIAALLLDQTSIPNLKGSNFHWSGTISQS